MEYLPTDEKERCDLCYRYNGQVCGQDSYNKTVCGDVSEEAFRVMLEFGLTCEEVAQEGPF